jgi:hypothetical protein
MSSLLLHLGRACLVDVDVELLSRWKGLEDGRRRGKKRGNMDVVKAFREYWLLCCAMHCRVEQKSRVE